MTSKKTIRICETALFAALVFLGVFIFKIPMPLGYTHLGDSMIFLAVMMLGGKRGAIAGGMGAALADVVAGYTVWAVPTFICKALMALVMGLVIEKFFIKSAGKFSWLVGGVAGGIVQSLGYLVFWYVLFGRAAMLSAVVPLIFQSGIGIGIAFVVAVVLEKTTLKKYFINMNRGGEIDG